jgi:transcriptional regulator with XRE-family HTH domain
VIAQQGGCKLITKHVSTDPSTGIAMNAINELLDNAKDRLNLGSDLALAERLAVTRSLVSRWRKGDTPLADDRIAQLCALAKADGPEWMARIHAEKAQSPAERALWSKMLTRLAAAAILLAPLSAGAADKSLENQVIKSEKTPVMYIM